MENALDRHMEQADRAYSIQGPEDIPYWELDLDGPPPWPEDEEPKRKEKSDAIW